MFVSQLEKPDLHYDEEDKYAADDDDDDESCAEDDYDVDNDDVKFEYE